MQSHVSTRRRLSALLSATVIAALFAGISPVPAHADTVFRITGGGWGHGIGLSQYGAKGYAEKGWPYDDVLRWFYGADRTGTKAGVKVATLASIGKNANPTVRVNLHYKDLALSSWSLRGWNSRLRVVDASGTVALLSADDYHVFTPQAGKVSVGGKTFIGTVKVSAETTRGVPLVVVRTPSGPALNSSYPSGYPYVRYRGQIQLTNVAGRLRAVNALPMEQYLYGVVPRESPSSFPAEALKAQAVAARSYAWGTNPPSSSASSSLSGILHCTTYSQVYGAHSRLISGDDSRISMHEVASTNAAVDATKGEVVYHSPSKTIVTTYFSSSTGGHTANIEDVWLSSTPKPYYVGVADADQGTPNYTWAPTAKTGAELATAFRVRDGQDGRFDFSAASPATVVDITEEKASSGYVRYATIVWSTGASYRVRGDTVRGALGLKSTKFTIAPLAFGTRYEDSDSRARYGGSWTVFRSANLSGGAYRYAAKAGASATFAFKGTGFRWVTSTGPTGGRADVYLDGAKKATVSLYASSYRYQRPAWTVTGLSADTTHTVVVKVTGTRDRASGGTNVGVDAVEVQGGTLVQPPAPAPKLTRFEQSDARVKYAGEWKSFSDARLSGGSYKYSASTTASVSFTFTGVRVRLVTMKYWGSGKAWVYLDKQPRVLVDGYSATQVFRQALWDSGMLTSGTHTVKIVPAGQRASAAKGYNVGIDAIDVWGGALK
ncbi:MAG: SpoIID/LytB domain-containing protein [Actinobacteria bacterium]|nr:MAG: SpoIID/LytB domain-containing protein [Actinomycetota bacterium]